MNKHFIKTLCLGILISFIILSFNSFVFAVATQMSDGGSGSSSNKVTSDKTFEDQYSKSEFGKEVSAITKKVKNWAFVIITLSAVATSVLFMISSFNPNTKNDAKLAFVGLLIGITMLILSNNIGRLMYGILAKNGSPIVKRDFGDTTKLTNSITDIQIDKSDPIYKKPR